MELKWDALNDEIESNCKTQKLRVKPESVIKETRPDHSVFVVIFNTGIHQGSLMN